MALKRIITKAEFDALSDVLKTEYKASGENFALDIDGDDNIDWKRKREIEAEHRAKAEKKLADAQEELDNLRRGAIPKADVEALENSWKTKLQTRETELNTQVDMLNGVITNNTVKNTAKDIAQMFLAPAAVIPMITSRLKSEIVNGEAVTRVLDKNGQLSAMTIDDLKNEFKSDATFAPILVGSQASGGGAAGSGGGNPGAGGKKLKDMNDQERVTLFKSNRTEFDRLVAEQNSIK